MYKNIITLIVTIVTLIISALFSIGKIPLNMVLFYLFSINGALLGSIGMASELTKEFSNLLFVLCVMIVFVAAGVLCKVYLPALYFSNIFK